MIFDGVRAEVIGYETEPVHIQIIADEAFAGIHATSVLIDENATRIGRYAFSDSHNLIQIIIPENVKEISPNAFNACVGLTLYGMPDSYAEWYAEEYGFNFVEYTGL